MSYIKRMEKIGLLVGLLSVGLSLMSCGTPPAPMKRLDQVKEVSADLPKDLQDRFEVREAGQSTKSGNLPAATTPGKGSSGPLGASASTEAKGAQKKGKRGSAAGATDPDSKSGLAGLPNQGTTDPSNKTAARNRKGAKKGSLRSTKEAESAPSSSPGTSGGGVAGPTAQPTPAVQAKVEIKARRPARDPIWVGERHVMNVTYFGMGGGTLTMDVLPLKIIGERKVYHLKGHAVSSKVFSLFYRVNDMVESYYDYEGLFSHRLHVTVDESKQSRDSLELNDFYKGTTFHWNRWNHYKDGPGETKESAEVPRYAQDTMTALFYLRGLPMKVGEVITFPVISEAKWWEAVVSIVGREMLDTPMGRKMAIKMKLDTKLQGVLQKRGDSFLWLSDDDRRFVLRLDAKVNIGTIAIVTREIREGTPPPRIVAENSQPQ